ncbi:MAG: PTS glucose transporter subunit IIA [Clostridia bacterium]|nr:PTS glucose transporter subunit IIA [Clostridia bacterium]
MNLFKRKKQREIYSPAQGEVIDASQINDPVFSNDILGKGFGVIPTQGTIFSPVNGEVVNAFESGHAYTILSEDGLEILIHIGIDTIELDGEGFIAKVRKGDKIKKREIIATVDLELLKKKGYDPTIAVIITNPDILSKIEVNKGKVIACEVALTYTI